MRPAEAEARPPPARHFNHVSRAPASLPGLSLRAGARAGVLGSVPPPLPRSPGANPPTRLLGPFSVASGAPWPLRHIRRSG